MPTTIGRQFNFPDSKLRLELDNIYRLIRAGGGALVATDLAQTLSAIQTAILSASTSWDPSLIADGAFEVVNVTVTGAVIGDVALASFPGLADGMWLSARVIGANTVRVTLHNESGAGQDLASGTLKVVVIHL